jgi:hypothetical protein
LRASLLGGLLFGAIGLALAQGSILRDEENSFVVRDFSPKTFRYEPGKLIRFSGTGSPLTIEAKSQGILLQANEASGEAKPNGKLFFLEQGQASGSAVVIMDTKVRQEFELAKKLRQALTPEQSRTRLDSANFTYTGSADEAKISTTSKLRVRSDTDGARTIKKEEKDVAQTYLQNLDLTGSAGTINLDPEAKTTSTNLKTGRIEGPVEFTFKRVEKNAGAEKPDETTLQGRGDLLTFDFTGAERQIILQGNVHLEGTGGFNGVTNVDRLIITVDEKLQPIRYETEGKPATTTVKTGGGK